MILELLFRITISVVSSHKQSMPFSSIKHFYQLDITMRLSHICLGFQVGVFLPIKTHPQTVQVRASFISTPGYSHLIYKESNKMFFVKRLPIQQNPVKHCFEQVQSIFSHVILPKDLFNCSCTGNWFSCPFY